VPKHIFTGAEIGKSKIKRAFDPDDRPDSPETPEIIPEIPVSKAFQFIMVFRQKLTNDDKRSIPKINHIKELHYGYNTCNGSPHPVPGDQSGGCHLSLYDR